MRKQDHKLVDFSMEALPHQSQGISLTVAKSFSVVGQREYFPAIGELRHRSHLMWGVCGALVESTPFVRRIMVRLPLWPPSRDLGQVLNSQLPVALQCEIPAQHPGCVGSASE